ncbi:MAG: hypothetical protein ABF636_00535 [Acetobacter sp.]
MTLRIIGETNHLNDFKYDTLGFFLLSITFTLLFSAYVCRKIALAGKGKKEKAYKMSVSRLDFAYVLFGFCAAIVSLAYLTSSNFQNFLDAPISQNEELLKNERSRFISNMVLIESHCLNNELSNDICTQSKSYESFLLSLHSPYAVRLDAQKICQGISLLKGDTYKGDQRISLFCSKPIFELPKQSTQELINFIENTRDAKYYEFIEGFLLKLLLVLTLSARFTKAIFDLLFNQCDTRKRIKIRQNKPLLKLRR